MSLFVIYSWLLLLGTVILSFYSVLSLRQVYKRSKQALPRAPWVVVFLFLVDITFIYFIGLNHIDQLNTISNFGLSISSSVKTYFGEFRFELVNGATSDSLVYQFLLVFASVIAFSNFIIHILFFVFKNVLNELRKYSFGKGIIYIMGDYELVKTFIEGDSNRIKSLKNYNVQLLVSEKEFIRYHGLETKVPFALIKSDDHTTQLTRVFKMNSSSEQIFFSLFEDDEMSMRFYVQLYRFIRDNPTSRLTAHLAYNDLEKLDLLNDNYSLHNQIQFFSYHRNSAYNLLFDYPLSTWGQKGKKVRFILLGFGNTNRQVYKHLLINNQVTELDIDYHIFSNDVNTTKEQFLHPVNYVRFQPESNKTYLPPVPNFQRCIQDTSFHMGDVLSKQFFDQLDDIDLKNSHNVFILAIDNDIQNLELSFSLSKYLLNKNIANQSNMYIRMRDGGYFSKSLYHSDIQVDIFGTNDMVYHMDAIKRNALNHLARLIDLNYQNNLSITQNRFIESTLLGTIQSIRLNDSEPYIQFKDALKEQTWKLYIEPSLMLDLKPFLESSSTLKVTVRASQNQANLVIQAMAFDSHISQLNYQSSLYAAISIVNKLNLMGLDLALRTDDTHEAINEDSYYQIYDPLNLRLSNQNGCERVADLVCYRTTNLRNKIAELEHHRWNYFNILNGYVPLSIEEITAKDKPTINNRAALKHACLTSFSGLENLFEQLIKHYPNLPKNQMDYLYKDYQVMDYLPNILSLSNYKIIKKTPPMGRE